MNQYQKYFSRKLLSDGCNVLVDYKDYMQCENCTFEADGGKLADILSAVESENVSVGILLRHGGGRQRYFYADVICIMGQIPDISERFSEFLSEAEITSSCDDLCLEDCNVYVLGRRKQYVINLSEYDFTYIIWE